MQKKPGYFKKLLSHLLMLPVEQTSGYYSADLEVVLYKGRYMLNTPSATYSFEDLYSSFRKGLHVIRHHLRTSNSFLLLGLGLGSVPRQLQKTFRYQGSITCVEIDGKIIRLAEKYYPDPKAWEALRIIHEDAETWVQAHTARFDTIAVDLFIDCDVPAKFQRVEFLRGLRELLKPSGVLLFSILQRNTDKEAPLFTNFRTVFHGATEIKAGGNIILCWHAPAL